MPITVYHSNYRKNKSYLVFFAMMFSWETKSTCVFISTRYKHRDNKNKYTHTYCMSNGKRPFANVFFQFITIFSEACILSGKVLRRNPRIWKQGGVVRKAVLWSGSKRKQKPASSVPPTRDSFWKTVAENFETSKQKKTPNKRAIKGHSGGVTEARWWWGRPISRLGRDVTWRAAMQQTTTTETQGGGGFEGLQSQQTFQKRLQRNCRPRTQRHNGLDNRELQTFKVTWRRLWGFLHIQALLPGCWWPRQHKPARSRTAQAFLDSVSTKARTEDDFPGGSGSDLWTEARFVWYLRGMASLAEDSAAEKHPLVSPPISINEVTTSDSTRKHHIPTLEQRPDLLPTIWWGFKGRKDLLDQQISASLARVLPSLVNLDRWSCGRGPLEKKELGALRFQ